MIHFEHPDEAETFQMVVRAMTVTSHYASARPERGESFPVAFCSLMSDLLAMATQLDIRCSVTCSPDGSHTFEARIVPDGAEEAEADGPASPTRPRPGCTGWLPASELGH